jgi:hypothetical protein
MTATYTPAEDAPSAEFRVPDVETPDGDGGVRGGLTG